MGTNSVKIFTRLLLGTIYYRVWFVLKIKQKKWNYEFEMKRNPYCAFQQHVNSDLQKHCFFTAINHNDQRQPTDREQQKQTTLDTHETPHLATSPYFIRPVSNNQLSMCQM